MNKNENKTEKRERRKKRPKFPAVEEKKKGTPSWTFMFCAIIIRSISGPTSEWPSPL